MFTGIVALAKIKDIDGGSNGWKLIIEAQELADKVEVGSSVAIDGACLSVTQIDGSLLSFFVSTETIDKTVIKNYTLNRLINVELPMQVGGYLGGHYVLGHVDVVGKVKEMKVTETAWFVDIEVPKKFVRYVVYKGSIAINGVSLTVNKITNNVVSLCIIPITLSKTNFNQLSINDDVNVEFDILAKYTEKLLNKNDE